ncbi:MAG TPA: GNAT family N-acetyltransferase [Longimicrobium sp.]|nr:GNAT family N-acetyltransferase [Longimicrobium sp.]
MTAQVQAAVQPRAAEPGVRLECFDIRMSEPVSVPPANASVSLREVTKENLGQILRLKVAPEQERFVASNAISIAQAYFDRDTAWFRAVYADDIPIGFLMLADYPDSQEYFLWRFMIDARYQGMGFGARAIELVLEHVRGRPGAKALGTSCVPGEGSPGAFYEKLGFEYTGEIDEGERVMRHLFGPSA